MISVCQGIGFGALALWVSVPELWIFEKGFRFSGLAVVSF